MADQTAPTSAASVVSREIEIDKAGKEKGHPGRWWTQWFLGTGWGGGVLKQHKQVIAVQSS